jgi:hypothetical protein
MLLRSMFCRSGDPVGVRLITEVHAYDGNTVPVAVTVILLDETPDDCEPETGVLFNDHDIDMDVLTPSNEAGAKPTRHGKVTCCPCVMTVVFGRPQVSGAPVNH